MNDADKVRAFLGLLSDSHNGLKRVNAALNRLEAKANRVDELVKSGALRVLADYCHDTEPVAHTPEEDRALKLVERLLAEGGDGG